MRLDHLYLGAGKSNEIEVEVAVLILRGLYDYLSRCVSKGTCISHKLFSAI